MGVFANALSLAVGQSGAAPRKNLKDWPGLRVWLLNRFRSRALKQPRLALLERINLAPRQTVVRYTRDGSFHRSQTGGLVTAANEPVLSSTDQPISIPPGEVAVGASGVISVSGGAVATVGVISFSDNAQLKPEGANRYVAPDDIKATQSRDAAIHQGALEGANQDVVQGTLDLIMMQRQAEMMQKALTVFHTEFNKTATEDLPRV